MNIDIFDLKNQLQVIDDKIDIYKKFIETNKIIERLNELKKLTLNEFLWNDPENAKKILQEESNLNEEIEIWNEILNNRSFAQEILDNLNINSTDEFDIINDIIENLRSDIEKIYTNILFNEKTDKSNCFLTIHCGSGGLESEDWARMLWEMYCKYAGKNFKTTVLDVNNTDDGGIKSATIKIQSGNKNFPFGYFKSEIGVHRLVRISPYDKKKQRHTSFASVSILPEINEEINIEINSDDLKVDTYRASGAGGQHVNKTDSAIRITHVPTGIIVQCQTDRSQHNNREEAMKMLKSKLYEKRMNEIRKEKEALSGEKKENTWGSQVRSYVQQPYQMVKDHRSNAEVLSFDKIVYDAELDYLINEYLKWKIEEK